MSDRDRIMLEGIVEDFSNGKFKVKIAEGHTALCTLSGKIRQNEIKIMVNDKVRIEVSPYNTSMGRILARLK